MEFINELDLREISRKKLQETLAELKARGRVLALPKAAENLCMTVVVEMLLIEAGCDTTKPGTTPAHIMLGDWASRVSKGTDPFKMGEKQIRLTICDEWAKVLVPLPRKDRARYDSEEESAY